MAYPIDDLQKFAESWLAMGNSHTDWQIGETMAEVLREGLHGVGNPGSDRRCDRGDRLQAYFGTQAADQV